MSQQQITLKRQQGIYLLPKIGQFLILSAELQQQYTNYKNNLQQLAQRIGEIEQDTEEHKYVQTTSTRMPFLLRHLPFKLVRGGSDH